MKLLTPTEIKDRKEKEKLDALHKLELVEKALLSAQNELNDSNAKFEANLARQRATWLKEEEEKMMKIDALDKEIEAKTKLASSIISSAEAVKLKYETLIQEAIKAREEAQSIKNEATKLHGEAEEMAQLLQDKLDDLGDREVKILEKERALTIREKAINEERGNIVRLSSELTKQLSAISPN